MRRTALLVPLLAAALGGTAHALPVPCRAAAVDPLGDTYGGAAPEPGADLTRIGFARAWGTLEVEVTVGDVDAAPVGTVTGREVRATFTVDGVRFVARWRESDTTFADLSRVAFASQHGPAGEPGSLAPVGWGEIGWEVVPERDAVLLHVPLSALEAHGVVVGPGTEVTGAAAATYAVAVVSVQEDPVEKEVAPVVPVDDMPPTGGSYRLGDGSCR
jgi:hypothetical protein